MGSDYLFPPSLSIIPFSILPHSSILENCEKKTISDSFLIRACVKADRATGLQMETILYAFTGPPRTIRNRYPASSCQSCQGPTPSGTHGKWTHLERRAPPGVGESAGEVISGMPLRLQVI